jgi:hypothetical protein
MRAAHLREPIASTSSLHTTPTRRITQSGHHPPARSISGKDVKQKVNVTLGARDVIDETIDRLVVVGEEFDRIAM